MCQAFLTKIQFKQVHCQDSVACKYLLIIFNLLIVFFNDCSWRFSVLVQLKLKLVLTTNFYCINAVPRAFHFRLYCTNATNGRGICLYQCCTYNYWPHRCDEFTIVPILIPSPSWFTSSVILFFDCKLYALLILNTLPYLNAAVAVNGKDFNNCFWVFDLAELKLKLVLTTNFYCINAVPRAFHFR